MTPRPGLIAALWLAAGAVLAALAVGAWLVGLPEPAAEALACLALLAALEAAVPCWPGRGKRS